MGGFLGIGFQPLGSPSHGGGAVSEVLPFLEKRCLQSCSRASAVCKVWVGNGETQTPPRRRPRRWEETHPVTPVCCPHCACLSARPLQGPCVYKQGSRGSEKRCLTHARGQAEKTAGTRGDQGTESCPPSEGLVLCDAGRAAARPWAGGTQPNPHLKLLSNKIVVTLSNLEIRTQDVSHAHPRV